MSCERALNFDRWKTLSENYKPMRVWLWLVYKFTENYCCLRLFSNFIQTQRMYPTSLDKIRILTWKLLALSSWNLFLWTKILKNLLLEKYLFSVAATLKSSKQLKIIFLFLLVINTLQYKECLCILTFAKCNMWFIDQIYTIYRPEKNLKWYK